MFWFNGFWLVGSCLHVTLLKCHKGVLGCSSRCSLSLTFCHTSTNDNDDNHNLNIIYDNEVRCLLLIETYYMHDPWCLKLNALLQISSEEIKLNGMKNLIFAASLPRGLFLCYISHLMREMVALLDSLCLCLFVTSPQKTYYMHDPCFILIFLLQNLSEEIKLLHQDCPVGPFSATFPISWERWPFGGATLVLWRSVTNMASTR